MGNSQSAESEPSPYVNANGNLDLWGIEVDYIDQITGQPRNPQLFAFVFQIPLWLGMDMLENFLEVLNAGAKVTVEDYIYGGGIVVGVPVFVGAIGAVFAMAGGLGFATFLAGTITAMEYYDGWTAVEEWWNEEYPKWEAEIMAYLNEAEQEYKAVTSYRATDDPNFNQKKREDPNVHEEKVVSFTNYEKWSSNIGSSTFLEQ